MRYVDDDECYRKHAAELMRFASALVGPGLAEDVLAAGVCRALAASSWPGVENKRAFLFRCVASEANRAARTAQRVLRREMRVAQREAFTEERPDLDVRAALVALSTRQRAVIYLTYWVDLSVADVAEIIGASARTVERELKRARQVLGRKLS